MLSFVMVFGLIVAPIVLLGTGYFHAIQAASRCRSAARPFLLGPPICSFVLTSGYMLWGYRAILTSKSSTAAVGLFLMPIFSLAVAMAGLAVSWSVLYAAHFVVQRIKRTPLGLTSLVLFALAMVVIVLTGYVVQGKVARHPSSNAAASGTEPMQPAADHDAWAATHVKRGKNRRTGPNIARRNKSRTMAPSPYHTPWPD
jgi:hypothetical protein